LKSKKDNIFNKMGSIKMNVKARQKEKTWMKKMMGYFPLALRS